MDPKKLKKLADACRKAGIKSYKDGEIEFTLRDDTPQKQVRKSTKSPAISNSSPDQDFQSDEAALTFEQLLNWSAAPGGVQIKDEEAS